MPDDGLQLPRRQPERQFEQRAEAGEIRRDFIFGLFFQLTVATLESVTRKRQFENGRARIVAEGRRLGIPVELARSFGIGFKTMLGARVVGAYDFL